jgi:hypothetical protein
MCSRVVLGTRGVSAGFDAVDKDPIGECCVLLCVKLWGRGGGWVSRGVCWV